MSGATPQSPAQPAPAQTQIKREPIGVTIIQGRCLSVRKSGNLFEHLVIMPAPDAYTSPSTVSVMGAKRHAEIEQDVKLFCRVTGYKRSYRSTDRDTGETRMVNTADNRLFVIED